MGIKATNKSLKEINEAKRYEQQCNHCFGNAKTDRDDLSVLYE